MLVEETLRNAENIFDRHVDYAMANEEFQGDKVFENIETAQQYADQKFGKTAGGEVFRFYGKDTDTGKYGIYTATYVGKEFYEGEGHKFYLSIFDEILDSDRGN